jgi:hypothetical protein
VRARVESPHPGVRAAARWALERLEEARGVTPTATAAAATPASGTPPSTDR